jgi:hypothetical protein
MDKESFSDDHPTKIRAVYYVDSERGNPVAISPTISKEAILWGDTSRGLRFLFTEINLSPKDIVAEKPPEIIEFTLSNGHKIRLLYLTRKIFDEKVKNRVAGGNLMKFSSDDELQKYYLETNFLLY